MCINLSYVSRLENRFEDLAYEKNQLKKENEELKLVLEKMALALTLQSPCSCYLKKEGCKNKDNCIECIINNFKNKIKQ